MSAAASATTQNDAAQCPGVPGHAACFCAKGDQCGDTRTGYFVSLPKYPAQRSAFLKILHPSVPEPALAQLIKNRHARVRIEHFRLEDVKIVTVGGENVLRRCPDALPTLVAASSSYTVESVAAYQQAQSEKMADVASTCICASTLCTPEPTTESNSVPLPATREAAIQWLKVLRNLNRTSQAEKFYAALGDSAGKARVFLSHFARDSLELRASAAGTLVFALKDDGKPTHFNPKHLHELALSSPAKSAAAATARKAPQSERPSPDSRAKRRHTIGAVERGDADLLADQVLDERRRMQRLAAENSALRDQLRRLQVDMAVLTTSKEELSSAAQQLTKAAEKAEARWNDPQCHAEKLIEQLRSNDDECQRMTGLPTFAAVEALHKPVKMADESITAHHAHANNKLGSLQQFVLFLIMFHRLRNDDVVVAALFSLSRPTVTRIYDRWLRVTAAVSDATMPTFDYYKALAVTPPSVQVQLGVPSNVAVFMGDCFETPILHSNNVAFDKATYSSYKSTNTLKYLVVVAANG